MILWWQCLLWCLLTLVIGGVIGFFAARAFFKKQLRDNPPINENMIRALYKQMGRKPSEAQIKAVMNSVNKEQR
ncbi:MAG: YneF family protein [Candidatus Onthovivens sp.]|nr:YneF family protein [Candidatus Onthovivens sp.]